MDNLVVFILIFVAGIVNALMDKVKNHWDLSVFSRLSYLHWFWEWAGPGSWRNKWKDGQPEKGERFPGSSTIFVWLTDFWHFAQFVWIKLVLLAIVLSQNYQPLTWYWWTDFLALWAIYSGVFELFYGYILDKDK